MLQMKLLYLEDDQPLAFVTTRALTKRGNQVTHIASIAEAEAVADPENYSHALLDLKLEDGNSINLIQYLLSKNSEMKIVVLTAYASIATAVQAIKLGAVNYLIKPATVEQILSAFFETENPDPVDDTPDTPKMSLKRLEWEQIQQALAENNGNISATARQLNMHRRTLQRKLNKRPVGK